MRKVIKKKKQATQSASAQAPAPGVAQACRVALIGNPNAGKTTLFNSLCGARQHTGNYAGVTVEKKTGSIKGHDGIEVIDLPGTYSLKPKSADEEITSRVLHGNAATEKKPDLAVVVLDAGNLKRSLYLCLQVQETGVPAIAVLTMSDIGERRGYSVQLEELQKQLHIPVCRVTRASRSEIGVLANLIAAAQSGEAPLAKKARLNEEKNRHETSIEERYAQIDLILRKALVKEARSRSVSQKIDSVLTHRLFGLIAFTLIIGAMFFSIYAGAKPVMDAIDGFMKGMGQAARAGLAGYPVSASLIADGVIAGAGSVLVFVPQIAILFLFVSILEETGYLARAAFLSDKLLGWTGLNGRAFIPLLSSFACAVPGILSARVMPTDRARMATILIAPLMSCSARLPVYVLFIGAFIEPRFGALWAAVALFGMHLVGISIAMPLAWLLNRHVLKKTGESPFILELPEYHMPRLQNVWRRVYDATMNFLKRVGGIIFALSIIIWALAYFPHSQKLTNLTTMQFAVEKGIKVTHLPTHIANLKPDERKVFEDELQTKLQSVHLRDSYLGRFGAAIEPFFRPLGFDWKISVAVLAAFPAREVFVSTLGIIYSVNDADENSEVLGKQLLAEKKADGKPAYDALLALSVMVFFALCAQCMSTLATIRRELDSTRWAVTVFVVLTGLAYGASYMVYQTGRWIG